VRRIRNLVVLEMTFRRQSAWQTPLISPFFWSISTRQFGAPVTDRLLAADNKASWTAPTRTSRLMPFSRSQNSKTAKKSAFIRSTLRLYPANKKVGRYASSDFARWLTQQTLPFLESSLNFWPRTRQAQTKSTSMLGKWRINPESRPSPNSMQLPPASKPQVRRTVLCAPRHPKWETSVPQAARTE